MMCNVTLICVVPHQSILKMVEEREVWCLVGYSILTTAVLLTLAYQGLRFLHTGVCSYVTADSGHWPVTVWVDE